MLRRWLVRASDALPALAALAAVLALVAPSDALAARSDLVLAALVLSTALTIAPAQLVRLGDHKAALATLVLAPFVVLAPLAWVIGRAFSRPVRDGVLALGVPHGGRGGRPGGTGRRQCRAGARRADRIAGGLGAGRPVALDALAGATSAIARKFSPATNQ